MAKMIIPIMIDWKSIEDYLKKADVVKVTLCKDCIKKPLCMIYRENNNDFGYCYLAGRTEE